MFEDLDLKIGNATSEKTDLVIVKTRTACNPGATCQSTLPKTTCY